MKVIIGRSTFILLVIFAVLFINVQPSNCQEEKFPRGAQYYLGTDDQLLIKVNVWGFVAKPGQYLIPAGTDLVSLISFAGGPREGAKLNNIKLIRMPAKNDDNQKVFKIDVDKFLKTGDSSIIPNLKPDDTIVVSGSKWYHVSKYLEFITKLAMLIQVYSWITYYSTKN